jgi:hypothetical protein
VGASGVLIVALFYTWTGTSQNQVLLLIQMKTRESEILLGIIGQLIWRPVSQMLA